VDSNLVSTSLKDITNLEFMNSYIEAFDKIILSGYSRKLLSVLLEWGELTKLRAVL
jgi:hypothetical protein